MGVEQTWSTWIFLGALGLITAGLLGSWSRSLRSWRASLPELAPEGWTPSSEYALGGRAVGAQLGSTFESGTDPRALWRIYWELPDRLVAVRRPKFPRPMGALVTTATTDGAEVEYDDTRVLLTGIDAAMIGQLASEANRLKGREGGADELIDLFLAAGAAPYSSSTTTTG